MSNDLHPVIAVVRLAQKTGFWLDESQGVSEQNEMDRGEIGEIGILEGERTGCLRNGLEG